MDVKMVTENMDLKMERGKFNGGMVQEMGWGKKNSKGMGRREWGIVAWNWG